VVLKLGTRVVTVRDNELNLPLLARVADEVRALMRRGLQVALVSSGAVGAGMGCLGLKERPRRISELQATAAVGQALLMHAYNLAFGDIPTGQVLLTDDGLVDRWRYVNARNTLEALFRLGAVPIINENDSVAVEENKVGDNDRLSALVTHLVEADLLVAFTTVDGLYSEDPFLEAGATLIPRVEEVTAEMVARAGSAGSAVSLGGMRTKLQAAQSVTKGGVPMVVANGLTASLVGIVEGQEVGTLFLPQRDPPQSRKLWLANTRRKGAVVVDAGAADAVAARGKSLLPSGVSCVTGEFSAGELIGVETPDGREIARGLVRYDAEDLTRICGRRISEVAGILGVEGDVVIHRDDLVVIENP
jgi:glutamate 5-kinase